MNVAVLFVHSSFYGHWVFPCSLNEDIFAEILGMILIWNIKERVRLKKQVDYLLLLS